MDMLEPGRFCFEVNFKKRYGNFINGQWVAPAKGEYFENITPVTGKAFCEIPRSSAEDVERALFEAFPNSEVIIHQEPAGIDDHRLDDNIVTLGKAEKPA